jgi:hypothetical protein
VTTEAGHVRSLTPKMVWVVIRTWAMPGIRSRVWACVTAFMLVAHTQAPTVADSTARDGESVR